jgi:hypothetical protein
MATTPEVRLVFRDGCPDCGERQVDLPKPLPPVDDHFDWDARDYDSIRMFAMEELAARYPERSRWTPADMEVVIVELIACLLDRYSNTLDVVQGEAKLETARRPESVRRLLAFIGYDATIETPRALYGGEIADDSETLRRKLERYWYRSPQAMAEARLLGPQKVHTQHRMVTLADYTERMEEHPLVLRARADAAWTGSWTSLRVVTVNWRSLPLDTALTDDPAVPDAQPLSLEEIAEIERFHETRGLLPPAWQARPTIRALLRTYLDAYRMAGQHVYLDDAVPVGIYMSISIRVAPTYYRSEVRRAIGEALGTGPAGFFAPGRLRFGEDLHLSDIVEVLMALDGVEAMCVNRFKKIAAQFPDMSHAGVIRLDGDEIAVCDNTPGKPARGFYQLSLIGGLPG